VLLTGGSQGIGAATVRLLHAAGANIFFTYRSRHDLAEGLCAELPDRVRAEPVDLAKPDALAPAVEKAARHLGGIDVLVNNAAVCAENPFDGDDFEAWRAGWRQTFAVNTFAAADLAWLAMREMRGSRRGGRIVNVASRSAYRGELTVADYAASKAALINLTKSIARSCARDGITAFCVAPGFIVTEMSADTIASDRDAITAEIPGGRIGTAEDIAGIIAFLASPLAAYATGATIDANGASYVR
jgi:3-oxoacyl-[acyl-carrier protein] reductase